MVRFHPHSSRRTRTDVPGFRVAPDFLGAPHDQTWLNALNGLMGAIGSLKL